jgi:putative transposase
MPAGLCYAIRMRDAGVIMRGYSARLYPSREQESRLHGWAGSVRFVWNRLLDAQRERYAASGTFIWRSELQTRVVGMKATHEWLKEVPAHALLQIAADLDRAVRKMIRDRKAGLQCGFPRYKKRFVREASIYCVNQRTSIDDNLRVVRLPKIGRVHCRGLRAINGRVLGARIVRDGKRWTLAVQAEESSPAPLPPSDTIVAIDLGVKRLATVFDGEKFLHVDAPRPLRKAERLLKRRQRRLSKRIKGSARRRAQVQRVAAVHRKVRNRRKEMVHQLTHRLTAKAGVVVVENLNVKGLASGMLAKSVRDAAFGAIFRTLAYKAAWRGRELVKVDRFFPSSQACSGCGEAHAEMKKLSRRTLRCDCGTIMDRDENAAVNLYEWYRGERGNRAGTSPTRGETGVQAHEPVPVVEPRI